MIGWLVYLVVVLAVSGLVGMHLGRFAEAYTEMTGMMAGMTMGMLNGFVLGFGAAAATNSMFWGNLFGILLGLCMGVYFGRPGGLMGIMDGGMGGVMGGSMGAMLAIMVVYPDYGLFWTAVLLTALYVLGMGGLVVLIEQSAPGHAALHRLAPFFTKAVAEEVEEVTEERRLFDEWATTPAAERAGSNEVRGQEAADCCPPPRKKKEVAAAVTAAAPSALQPSSIKVTTKQQTQGQRAVLNEASALPQSKAASTAVTPSRQSTQSTSRRRSAGWDAASSVQVGYAQARASGQEQRGQRVQRGQGGQRGQRAQTGQQHSSPVSWVGVVAAVVIVTALAWLVLTMGSRMGMGAGSNQTGNNRTSANLGEITGTSATGSLQLTLSLSPDPPQGGPTDFTLKVKDQAGQPLSGAQIRWSMDMTNMRMGAQGGQMTDIGSGSYQARGAFSMGGPWRISVELSKDGQSLGTGYFDLQVR